MDISQRKDFRVANLIKIDFQGAKLIEANLIKANLEGVNLEGANLQKADL